MKPTLEYFRSLLYKLFLIFIGTMISFPLMAMSVIRDDETEALLLDYMRSIFKAVGLPEENSDVIIINDPSINAFVASGQTIFVHTGLLTKAKSPDELMFVLAHETGHIVGGHIVRGHQAMEKAHKTALISTVIGGVLAAASGHPDAGIAVMMGGQGSALGLFTSYRQTEESSADRVAVDILDKLGYSMLGFEGIMKSLMVSDRLNASEDGSYLRTHPMTQTRVADLKRFLKNPRALHKERSFDLMQAKLSGFLNSPEDVLLKYKGTDIADLYAQAIAYYRMNNFLEAFKKLNLLIQKDNVNPYFYELKGQLFFETGKLEEAEKAYQKANDLKPDSRLIKLSYAHVLLEIGGRKNAEKAESLLKFILMHEPSEDFAWQLLAKAYDITNKKNEASYAMVEYFKAIGNTSEAIKLAQKIINDFDKKSVIYQKLEDVIDEGNLSYQKEL